MTATMSSLRDGRTLVPEALFDRLSRYIADNEMMEIPAAEAIMSNALSFLAACAVNHETPLSPSTQVDIGWHAFVLHTLDYAKFCERVAGRFIHHVPTDDKTATNGVSRTQVNQTMQAIKAAGFATDAELWLTDGRCSQCKDGCADDPPPNPPN